MILTRKELEDPSYSWLHALELQIQEGEENDDSYESLASLLVASPHVCYWSQVGNFHDPHSDYSRLVGGTESLSSSPLPGTAVKLSDIKKDDKKGKKPVALGHISRYNEEFLLSLLNKTFYPAFYSGLMNRGS